MSSTESRLTSAQLHFRSSRKVNKESWKINSLDLVLGLVGGLSSIIWGFLLLIFGNYESFKLENSIIGQIYETRPKIEEDDDIDDEEEAK